MSKTSLTRFFCKEKATAHHIDKTSSEVEIRQLTVRSLIQHSDDLGNEPAFLEIVTGMGEGWADSLTLESYTDLCEKAWALNRPTLLAYLERQQKRNTEVRPK